METISKRIAGAEILKIRRTEETLFLIGILTPLIIYGINIFTPDILPVVVVAGTGLFGYFYLNAKKESERLVEKYEL